MKIKVLHIYLSLLLIHSLVACVSFRHTIFQPDKYAYCDYGDGVKNYFTLYSYVKEPISKDGLFKYEAMNYPYGEYVLYTDNTPLFSIPFKWFCHHIYDLSGSSIQIYNWLVVLNIILAGLLIFYAFSNLLNDRITAYILAITLPWTNIQVLRIWRGHMNLSFSSFIILAICLLVLWHKHRHNKKNLVWIGIAMVLLSFTAFLAHAYYLPVIVLFLCSALFFYGISARKKIEGRFSLAASLVIAAAAAGLIYSFIYSIDAYLDLRPMTNSGYDWMEQKTRFTALFKGYYFHTFDFPLKSSVDTSDERSAYLGNIALYAFAVIVLLTIFSKSIRVKIWEIQKAFFRNALTSGIFLASLLMLFVSMGERYCPAYPAEGPCFYNVLNPFLYLHFVTDMVEQFRCLGRFVWPFYFGFTLWTLYNVVKLIEQYPARIRIGALILISGLGLYETIDFCREIDRRNYRENFFSENNRVMFRKLHINYNNYQAVLPIPYFTIGSEDFDHTINDIDGWSNYCFRLSIQSGLPLMACKLSRTPPIFNRSLLALVAKDSMTTDLAAMMNDKKVLVVVNKKYIADATINPSGNDIARTYYTAANDFAVRNKLQAIDSLDDVVYYDWEPEKMRIVNE